MEITDTSSEFKDSEVTEFNTITLRRDNSHWSIFRYSKSKCTICQDEYKEDEIQIKLKCSHDFHEKCFTDYENSLESYEDLRCPVCRSVVPKMNQETVISSEEDIDREYIPRVDPIDETIDFRELEMELNEQEFGIEEESYDNDTDYLVGNDITPPAIPNIIAQSPVRSSNILPSSSRVSVSRSSQQYNHDVPISDLPLPSIPSIQSNIRQSRLVNSRSRYSLFTESSARRYSLPTVSRRYLLPTIRDIRYLL